MTAAVAPPGTDPLEQAARRNLRACAEAHGIWQPTHIISLPLMASMVASYCRHAAAAGPAQHEDRDAMRVLVRDVLCNWHWIEPERTAPPLRPDMVDPDAARLCGLPELSGTVH